MKSKKYSVLMSVYYKENPIFLKDSINSMLEQTIPPDEIVLVKDGDLTNELDEMIYSFKSEYPNLLSVVSLPQNIGLGLALNEGLKKCRNEFVARMDTDDISKKNRCELQLEKFHSNEDLSIVGSHIDEFYENPNNVNSSRQVPIKHKDILKFSRRRNPFNHPTVMYKKTEVLACGGYGDFRRNQDLDLFVRMLNKGYKAENIDSSLVLFRANKDNLIRRKSWVKIKSYVSMIYGFWKKGYSSIFDLIIVVVSQAIIFIAPLKFLEWISNKFLRKKE
ncbi:glycosyltransferase [Virgibacillus sp. Bac330]|uniref:glycosyltransferase n=1 Tax=Virgibacillus sp. Bac330 TaxID=2419841 RepID=UPI000EF43DB0|nr:glycosyltransferase [Virgibacillus sp. Bac330]